jgi:hypothetical protein
MEMKNSGLIAAGLLGATLCAVQPASAQTGCEDIVFSSAITNRLPEAEESCLGVQSREGELYAHFQAEVVGVSGNTVRAKFRQPDGEYSETYAFEMQSDDRVTIDGRKYRYRDLSRGQELDIYLPGDRWEFYIPEEEDFTVATTVAVAMPYEPAQMEPETLPKTASPLPLLGAIGGLLTMLGLGLIAIRRRLFG